MSTAQTHDICMVTGFSFCRKRTALGSKLAGPKPVVLPSEKCVLLSWQYERRTLGLKEGAAGRPAGTNTVFRLMQERECWARSKCFIGSAQKVWQLTRVLN